MFCEKFGSISLELRSPSGDPQNLQFHPGGKPRDVSVKEGVKSTEVQNRDGVSVSDGDNCVNQFIDSLILDREDLHEYYSGQHHIYARTCLAIYQRKQMAVHWA